MRDHLILYLLDALDADERQTVETALASDFGLQHELQLLAEALRPLDGTKVEVPSPSQLATRTCQAVAQRAQAVTPSARYRSPSQWTFTDMIVAASMLLALTTLFVPSLYESQYLARLTQCQDKLRQLGMSVMGYSEKNDGFFPRIETKGPFAVAGMYAPRLSQRRYIGDMSEVVCPGSLEANERLSGPVPTIEEIAAASPEDLRRIHRQVGGSFAYNLGYLQDGQYFATRNRHRPHFVILADAPALGMSGPLRSLNHDGRVQNVLFEDGHVVVRASNQMNGDLIFLNDQGLVAAGLHPDDAVVAPSPVSPLSVPIVEVSEPRH